MQIYRHELNKREDIKQETYLQNAPSREDVTQMAQAAAEKIQGVLGSFGASFMGGGQQTEAPVVPKEAPRNEERKMNYENDEDDWAKMRE